MNYKLTLLVVSALIVMGCASSFPTIEDTHGDSVRSMIDNQIADPATAANPDPEPVMGYDGNKGEKVITNHTRNVATPEQTATQTVINIGK